MQIHRQVGLCKKLLQDLHEVERSEDMTLFRGFKTKEEALAFKKKHGGYLCYMYNKNGRKSTTQRDYLFAVHMGGLDAEKYPYCLQWSNR